MSERSCLNCTFGDPTTPPGSKQTLCEWLIADCTGGDRIATWAHEALFHTLRRSGGVKLVDVDTAETCPAFEPKSDEPPAGPLSEIITKGGAQ